MGLFWDPIGILEALGSFCGLAWGCELVLVPIHNQEPMLKATVCVPDR